MWLLLFCVALFRVFLFFSFSLISGLSIDRVFLGTKLVMKVFLARYTCIVGTYLRYRYLPR